MHTSTLEEVDYFELDEEALFQRVINEQVQFALYQHLEFEHADKSTENAKPSPEASQPVLEVDKSLEGILSEIKFISYPTQPGQYIIRIAPGGMCPTCWATISDLTVAQEIIASTRVSCSEDCEARFRQLLQEGSTASRPGGTVPLFSPGYKTQASPTTADPVSKSSASMTSMTGSGREALGFSDEELGMDEFSFYVDVKVDTSARRRSEPRQVIEA